MQTPHSLLERLRSPDDRIAWERFVDLFVPLVDRWVREWGADLTDADDLVQDIFARLLQLMPEFQYEPGRSFHAWLCTVSRNHFKQFRRKKRAVPLEGMGDDIPEKEPSSFEDVEFRGYLLQQAMRVMQRDFDGKTWRAFEQTVMHDRSTAEISRELGISPNAVYLARARVLARLRHELAGLAEHL